MNKEFVKLEKVKKVIKGTEYTAQFNGALAALEAIDRTYIKGTDNTSMVKMTEYVFEHVIVAPSGLTPNNFESTEEPREVVRFGREVMNGKLDQFRNDKGTNKEAGKN